METSQKEHSGTELLIRLDATLWAEIERYSEKAGESLDTFLSKASADLIHRRKAEEWFARPRQSTAEERTKAIELLDRPSGNPALPVTSCPKL